MPLRNFGQKHIGPDLSASGGVWGWFAPGMVAAQPWRTRYYGAAAITLVGIQIAVLHNLGQSFMAASGLVLLWVNDPFSPEMSQQLADWYSFSHIIHGFIFFGILRLLAPRLSLGARLLLAMGVEIAWEIAETVRRSSSITGSRHWRRVMSVTVS